MNANGFSSPLVTMPGQKYSAVFEVAAESFGYIKVEQAREVDVSPKTLHMMTKRGTLEHVSTGLYRVVALPPSAHSEYMEASLWPRGAQGVVSHDSALVLHELSDVNPAKIHITLPTGYRITRPVPPVYAIHGADLGDHDIEQVNGIPVTTPARTIMDCCRAHLGPALIRQAIDDGLRKGLLDASGAERLRMECLGSPGSEHG